MWDILYVKKHHTENNDTSDEEESEEEDEEEGVVYNIKQTRLLAKLLGITNNVSKFRYSARKGPC